MFKHGDVVKLVGPYNGMTYHVAVFGMREGWENDGVFVGEIVYNEFDTEEFPGCAVGTIADDFHIDNFEVVYHAII